MRLRIAWTLSDLSLGIPVGHLVGSLCTMLQLNDAVEPESPGPAAVLHPAETEEGVEVAFTPPEAGRSLGHAASVACCPPLQTLTPFHVHNPTVQAKVKDYFVFRVGGCATPLSSYMLKTTSSVLQFMCF